MGLFDKIKNMFTEEEEEEVKEPIKKEVFQVEIPAPKIEEKKEDVAVEVKKEEKEKFVFPVYFDDADFEDQSDVKESVVPQKTRPLAEMHTPLKKDSSKNVETKKRFKLSPVISPVYGVLDKNYKKEDIIEKKSGIDDYFSYKGDSALRVDKVRKKAFGTLEDDLESSLVQENYTEQVVTSEIKDSLDAEAIRSDNHLENMFFDDLTLEEAISKYELKDEGKEKTPSEADDLIESDLFNLIDSMYDKDTKEEN